MGGSLGGWEGGRVGWSEGGRVGGWAGGRVGGWEGPRGWVGGSTRRGGRVGGWAMVVLPGVRPNIVDQFPAAPPSVGSRNRGTPQNFPVILCAQYPSQFCHYPATARQLNFLPCVHNHNNAWVTSVTSRGEASKDASQGNIAPPDRRS